jgi:hypothetical protein
VKNSLFSYILLFSFSLIVLHNIVPHHHHDIYSANGEQQFEHQSTDRYTHAHAHHDQEHHSHHHAENPEKDHSSPDKSNSEFPQHHHFLVAGDFEFTRVSHETPVFKYDQGSPAIVSLFLQNDAFELPGSIYKVFKFPWLIHSNYEPAIFLLRAPPHYA